MPYFGASPSSELANLDINGQKLILDADADTSITSDTDDQIDIEIAGADDFQFTANTFTAQSGSTIAAQALTATTLTGSGVLSIDDTTDSTSGTSGSIHTDGGLGVAKDIYVGSQITIQNGSAGAPSINLAGDTDTGLYWTSQALAYVTDTTERARFAASNLYLADTANANMTAANGGITINQTDADNEILSLKSSDVSHSNTGDTEADTYTYYKKYSGTAGGLKESNQTEGIVALWHDVVHDTQQSAAASDTAVCPYNVRAIVTADSYAHDANVALFAWRKTISGGSSRNIVLFDEDGDIHLDGSTSAFDKDDDALLCRSFDLALADPKTIIKSEFDNWTANHKEKLIEAGILGHIDPDNPAHYSYPEQAVAGSPASDPSNPPVLAKPMINSTQLQRLHNGAIWQQRLMFETLKEVAEELLPGFASKLNERLESKHLPALPA